jgi:hypothetical protein
VNCSYRVSAELLTALLQVKVSGGLPVQARLFLLRPRSNPAAPAN